MTFFAPKSFSNSFASRLSTSSSFSSRRAERDGARDCGENSREFWREKRDRSRQFRAADSLRKIANFLRANRENRRRPRGRFRRRVRFDSADSFRQKSRRIRERSSFRGGVARQKKRAGNFHGGGLAGILVLNFFSQNFCDGFQNFSSSFSNFSKISPLRSSSKIIFGIFFIASRRFNSR